jgi:DNA polymerase III delta prime subunit
MLLKLNINYYFFPLIFISNNQHNKIISEIKKKSNQIKFHIPDQMSLYRITNKILCAEHVKIEDETIYDDIIEYSQGDIRKLIVLLNDIYNLFGRYIKREDIDKYLSRIGKKKKELELSDKTSNILYEFSSIEECFRNYNTDKVLLPLMLLHNHINIVNKDKYLEQICEIEDFLSKGDIVENYIYSEQNWDLQDIHGLYTCVYPSYILHKLPKRKEDINFTTDLNKTSIKNINKKHIVCINNYLKNMNIIDIIYVSKIIKNLINKKDLETSINIFKQYNIKLDGYESLLKIDKIDTDTDKIKLSYKQKKELVSNIK